MFIAESDPLLESLCRGWLEDAGFDVLTSLASAANRPIAVALVNVPSPKTARNHVRRLQVPAAVPVILMSARLSRAASSSSGIASRLGVRGLLSKPFSRDQMLDAIHDALGSTG